ncbi:MAG: VanZ family protein [Verrucomicrobiota bacterium]
MAAFPTRWLGAWWPALAWAGVIFYGSTEAFSARRTSRFLGPVLRWLFPGLDEATVGTVQFLVRKGWHFTEYALLALLVDRALRRQPAAPGSPLHRAAFTFLLAAGYACLDEFHQSFHPSRQGSPVDVLIDSAGALAGLAAVHLQARGSAAPEFPPRPA